MNIKILFISIIFLSFIILPSSSTPEKVNRLNTCDTGCHEKVSMENYSSDQECGSCHNYINLNTKNIDINRMEIQHNPNTCKLCHSASDKYKYHTIHTNVNCIDCHKDARKVEGKNINECTSCHAAQIHNIHSKTNICIECHGKNLINPNNNQVTKIENKEIKKYTIFEFLRNLFFR